MVVANRGAYGYGAGLAVLLGSPRTSVHAADAARGLDLRVTHRRGGIDVWYRLGERPASIDLRILDVRGRALRVLDRGERGPGDHWIQWNGTDAHGQRLASGVYFVRLSYGGLARAEKCVLMR
jgi:hypothetical protein